MSNDKDQTRDRVRELVRQVLATVPTEGESSARPPTNAVEHVVVNSLQHKLGREFDRDESARSLITEDDLRGLEPGSRLRVAQNVKFTSLAEDIVNERKIELIRIGRRAIPCEGEAGTHQCKHHGDRDDRRLLSHLI